MSHLRIKSTCSAIANKLTGGGSKDRQCRMEEITANGMPGITIRADQAPHITMTMVAGW